MGDEMKQAVYDAPGSPKDVGKVTPPPNRKRLGLLDVDDRKSRDLV
jgi:hypothetical protein